ncbi:MAG: zinc-dependent metalloprotease [Chloroflexi bacterium]|nr:zinc-dependent metalloprotease [Chloroflexota bacterium]
MTGRQDRPTPSRGALRGWQVGLLLGAATGAAISVLGRRAERSAREGLVDWARVERLAAARLRSAPGRLSASELAAAEPAYREAMARVVPALEAHLGVPLPGVVGRVEVVDRAGWVAANLATFEGLFERVERAALRRLLPPGAGLAKSGLVLADRWLTSAQLGLLLGFLGRRVLGQYDLALLAAEAAPGQLLFVEENIRQAATSLRIPADDFRTWVALHEATHAFQFEAHPWLRPWLASRLERQLDLLAAVPASLVRDVARGVGRTARGSGGGHWLERLMGPEERRLFRETQAVMSLLEGYADHVMESVGHELLPGAASISARFHARRAQRSPLERAVFRLTGMDLKLEQYARGAAFVAAIETAAGPAGLGRLWEGPEQLPRADEIDDPQRWLRRTAAGAVAGDGARATGDQP